MFNRVTFPCIVALIASTWLTGCADLTEPAPIRVMKDRAPATIQIPANVQGANAARPAPKGAGKHLPLAPVPKKKAGGG